MNLNLPDRRMETRYALEFAVVLWRDRAGTFVSARSLNVSSSGIYLQFKEPLDLHLGERVTCELNVAEDDARPLPSWGMGTVVRVDERGAAIEFRAGAIHRPAAHRTEPTVPAASQAG